MAATALRFHTPRPSRQERPTRMVRPYSMLEDPEILDHHDTSAWDQVRRPEGRAMLLQLAQEIERTGWRPPREYMNGWNYVQRAPLAELRYHLPKLHGSSFSFVVQEERPKLLAYNGNDAYGTPSEIWQPTMGSEQIWNFFSARASHVRLPGNGPWLGSGRDPRTNWGITLVTNSRYNADLLNQLDPYKFEPADSRYQWTCCGQRQDHPGCWINLGNGGDEGEIVTYDALTGRRGTAWLEVDYYTELHEEMVQIRRQLGAPDPGDAIDNATLQAGGPLVTRLFELEHYYNQVHGSAGPRSWASIQAKDAENDDYQASLEEEERVFQEEKRLATLKREEREAELRLSATQKQAAAAAREAQRRAEEQVRREAAELRARQEQAQKIVRLAERAEAETNAVSQLYTSIRDNAVKVARGQVAEAAAARTALNAAAAENAKVRRNLKSATDAHDTLNVVGIDALLIQQVEDALDAADVAMMDMSIVNDRATVAVVDAERRANSVSVWDTFPSATAAANAFKAQIGWTTDVPVAIVDTTNVGDFTKDEFINFPLPEAFIDEFLKTFSKTRIAYIAKWAYDIDLSTKLNVDAVRVAFKAAMETTKRKRLQFATDQATLQDMARQSESLFNAAQTVIASAATVADINTALAMLATNRAAIEVLALRAEKIVAADGRHQLEFDYNEQLAELSTLRTDAMALHAALEADRLRAEKEAEQRRLEADRKRINDATSAAVTAVSNIVIGIVQESQISTAKTGIDSVYNATNVEIADIVNQNPNLELVTLAADSKILLEAAKNDALAKIAIREVEFQSRKTQRERDEAAIASNTQALAPVKIWIDNYETKTNLGAAAFLDTTNSSAGLAAVKKFIAGNPNATRDSSLADIGMFLRRGASIVVPVQIENSYSIAKSYNNIFRDATGTNVQGVWTAWNELYKNLILEGTSTPPDWGKLKDYTSYLPPQPVSTETAILPLKSAIAERTPFTLPTKINELFETKRLDWKDNSCWIDAILTSIFIYPNSTVIQNVFSATQLYSRQIVVSYETAPIKNVEGFCSSADIVRLHDNLLKDIQQLQDKSIVNVTCSQLREYWSECFFDPNEYSRNLSNSLTPALDGIIEMHQLQSLKHIKGAVDALQVTFPNNLVADNVTVVIETGVDATMMRQTADQWISVDYNPLDFWCISIISQSLGHYVSYSYDFLKGEWMYIDPKQPKWEFSTLPARVNYINNPKGGDAPIETIDNQVVVTKDGYHPAYYVFMRVSEIESILRKSTNGTVTVFNVDVYTATVAGIRGFSTKKAPTPTPESKLAPALSAITRETLATYPLAADNIDVGLEAVSFAGSDVEAKLNNDPRNPVTLQRAYLAAAAGNTLQRGGDYYEQDVGRRALAFANLNLAPALVPSAEPKSAPVIVPGTGSTQGSGSTTAPVIVPSTESTLAPELTNATPAAYPLVIENATPIDIDGHLGTVNFERSKLIQATNRTAPVNVQRVYLAAYAGAQLVKFAPTEPGAYYKLDLARSALAFSLLNV